MARSRNIKPSFFQNEHLAETSPHARLLFIGLWCIADREGRLEDRPKRIKANLFPYEEINIDKLLNELASSNGRFILRYKTTDNCYIQVVNFSKHQSPHIKECASTIPEPDLSQTSTRQAPDIAKKDYDNKESTSGDTINTRQAPDKHQTSTSEESLIPDSLNLIPDSLNLIPDSLNLIPSISSTKMNDLFLKFWLEYPKKVSKGTAKKAFTKIKPSEELVNKMVSALNLHKKSEQWNIDGGKFIPNPATWLNAEKWLDETPTIKNNGSKPKGKIRNEDYYSGGELGKKVVQK